jgi:ribosomal protein S18 acetylase RimI-like enzyme
MAHSDLDSDSGSGSDSEPAVVIRPAGPDDFDAVGAFGAALVRMHYAFDARRFMRPGSGLAEGYSEFLEAESARRGVIVLVAEEAGRVVGYAYAAIEPLSWQELREEAGVIHDLFVDDAARRRGVAARLVEAAVAWFREQGMPRVIIHTAEKNGAAQHLFDKLGFRRTMVEMTREIG